MLARITLPQAEFKEMLDSLHGVAMGDEEMTMDLNLIADPDEGVKIYVRNYNSLQVSHEITDFDHLQVSEYSEFVFNSQTLYDLVKGADSNEIILQFSEDEFSVAIGNGYFATPTRFDLNLVKETEFQSPIMIDDFIEVATLDQGETLNNLKMMDSLSPVVEIEVADSELWLKVSDIVQGDGMVMQDIGDKDVPEITYQYSNAPLKDFLKRSGSEKVKLFLTDTGTLKLEAISEYVSSKLLQAPRVDTH